MANKRAVDELELQLEQAELPKRAKGGLTCNEQEVRAGSDDAGPSHQSRDACSDDTGPPWPKHKIFLSHSGVQKAFTERLCEALERVHHFPFFDRRADSLPKGERFYSRLMTAAQRCRVAVIVLSEEFLTKTKWPMMELNEFVKAQKLDEGVRILPLYFQIAREELGGRDRQARWIEAWQVMASEDNRIDVKEWECALRQLPGNNGMSYGGNTEGEGAFIHRVVEEVCRLLPPDVKWDVSHVRSMNELSEQPILLEFKDAKRRTKYNVQVVGLYGMGGVGKTTISRAICNIMLGEFVGKVCYIEFGTKNVAELLRIVLRELTGADPMLLKDYHHDQLLDLLKERIHRQKVFLVLDNVLDDHKYDAQMFLNVRYCDGSMVLVTSRSSDTLEYLKIHKDDCLVMPSLRQEGAIDLFLQHADLCRESMKDEEWEVIKRCVSECYFKEIKDGGCGRGVGDHYLPLALKALGSHLRSSCNDVIMWEEKLGRLQNGKGEKFNMAKEKIHPVFSVLRLGYDALPFEEQHIFLDLAILLPLYFWPSVDDDMQSIGILHGKTKDEIQDSVNILLRKGLLDSVYKGDKLKVNIHDLYKEFAKAESQGGPFDGRQFLVSMEEADRIPRELLKHPPNGTCWPSLRRIVIRYSKIRSLTGEHLCFCKNVELLDLRGCEKFEVLDVTGMDNLRCVIVSDCPKLRKWIGLGKLHHLNILRFNMNAGNCPLMRSFIQDLSSLTALQVLELRELIWCEVDRVLPDLSACTNLQLLIILLSGYVSGTAWGFRDFCHHLPKSLLKIDFSGCRRLLKWVPMSLMRSFTNLEELNVSGCQELKDLTALCEVTSLQLLFVTNTPICELPGNMKNLKHLQVLDVSFCWKLTSLVGISQCAASLWRLIAFDCVKLRDLPDDFSCFQKLEIVDLSYCISICILRKGCDRLVGHLGNGTLMLRAEGCFGIILPLVKMLQLPEKSHVKCVDGCRFGVDSMQSRIDGWKHVNSVAYELLRSVCSGVNISHFWTYMLDEVEVVDFLIRSLCEHDDRDVNRTHRLLDVYLASNDCIGNGWQCWCMLVVTAPCTFGILLERAKLVEPWRKTLLHYSISFILPVYVGFLKAIEGIEGLNLNRIEVHRCLYMGMKTLLEKCNELLENAIVLGILPVHNREGKKVVDIFSSAIAVANGQVIEKDSILWCDDLSVNYARFYGAYSRTFHLRKPFEVIDLWY